MSKMLHQVDFKWLQDESPDSVCDKTGRRADPCQTLPSVLIRIRDFPNVKTVGTLTIQDSSWVRRGFGNGGQERRLTGMFFKDAALV